MRSPAVLAALISCARLFSQPVAPCSTPPLVVTHATLWTATGSERDTEILVVDGRVSAVGRSGKIKRPRGATVIDARNDTLLPGLIDAHAHFFESGGPWPEDF